MEWRPRRKTSGNGNGSLLSLAGMESKRAESEKRKACFSWGGIHSIVIHLLSISLIPKKNKKQIHFIPFKNILTVLYKHKIKLKRLIIRNVMLMALTYFINSSPLFTVIILFISSNSSAINPILSAKEEEKWN